MSKKEITNRISIDLVEGKIDDMIKELQALKEKHPEAIDLEIGYEAEEYESVHTTLYVSRLETDIEYDTRKHEEALSAKRKREGFDKMMAQKERGKKIKAFNDEQTKKRKEFEASL